MLKYDTIKRQKNLEKNLWFAKFTRSKYQKGEAIKEVNIKEGNQSILINRMQLIN